MSLTGPRRTSTIAYEEIMEAGYISKTRRETYDYLYQHGPLTGAELDLHFHGSRGHHHKRLSELRDLHGVVEEVGERVCTVTGHLAILWDVNDALPRKKRASKEAKIEKLQKDEARLVERLAKVRINLEALKLPEVQKLKPASKKTKVPPPPLEMGAFMEATDPEPEPVPTPASEYGALEL